MWNLLIPAITQVLDKVLPDPQAAAEAKLKALEMAQRGELAQLDVEVQVFGAAAAVDDARLAAAAVAAVTRLSLMAVIMSFSSARYTRMASAGSCTLMSLMDNSGMSSKSSSIWRTSGAIRS